MSIPPHAGDCTVDSDGCLTAASGEYGMAVFDTLLSGSTATGHIDCILASGSGEKGAKLALPSSICGIDAAKSHVVEPSFG